MWNETYVDSLTNNIISICFIITVTHIVYEKKKLKFDRYSSYNYSFTF